MLPAAPRASDIFNDCLLVRPPRYDLRDACGRAVSLPAVDAYAQSRRLQPVLRASETAAPPASVQKLRLRRVVSVLSHSPERFVRREAPQCNSPDRQVGVSVTK
jgi:hypothetical protein